MPTLSILIPTLPSRASFLDKLLAELGRQTAGHDIEVQTLLDDGEISIGTKRSRMVEKATGEWLCFIDDDDEIVPTYVQDIVGTLSQDPDCVTFWCRFSLDGVHKYDWCYRPGPRVRQDDVWYMPPNHLCPVRASIAKETPFRDLSKGEDAAWAKDLAPKLNRVAHIDKVLYHYLLRNKPKGS